MQGSKDTYTSELQVRPDSTRQDATTAVLSRLVSSLNAHASCTIIVHTCRRLARVSQALAVGSVSFSFRAWGQRLLDQASCVFTLASNACVGDSVQSVRYPVRV